MPEAEQKQQEGEAAGLTFEKFAGVQTATTRPGVPDEQAYWIDGFIPLAPRNLRTLYGIGAALYTAPGALTIVCYYFYNIGAIPYAVVFLSDGSAVQVATATGTVTPIMVAGTITTPTIPTVGITQSSEQYLIIVANQTNGYWLWDGINLYAAGTLAPGVVLSNVGEGYQTVPTVTASGGTGYGATFLAQISGGVVTGVSITNPGAGYLAGQTVSLIFTGGTQAGSGGTASASFSHQVGGSLATISAAWFATLPNLYCTASLSITAGGTGYGSLASASFAAPLAGQSWVSSAPPSFKLSETGGTISSVSLVPGSGNPNMQFVNPAIPGQANVVSSAGGSLITITLSGTFTTGFLAFDASNQTAIPYGASVVRASGYTFGVTTITLSQPIAGSGVGVNDSLAFINGAFPAVSISDSGYYYVSSVSVSAHGSGYGPSALITASGGGSPLAQAALTLNLYPACRQRQGWLASRH